MPNDRAPEWSFTQSHSRNWLPLSISLAFPEFSSSHEKHEFRLFFFFFGGTYIHAFTHHTNIGQFGSYFSLHWFGKTFKMTQKENKRFVFGVRTQCGHVCAFHLIRFSTFTFTCNFADRMKESLLLSSHERWKLAQRKWKQTNGTDGSRWKQQQKLTVNCSRPLLEHSHS